MEPILPGLPPCRGALLDERQRPDFRDVFGTLARDAVDIATAVRRVRLSALEVGREDLERAESVRVLVSELNALTLGAEARFIRADRRRAPRVALFREMLESGRLEVRSAPLGGWSPDFTVFSGADGPKAVVLGSHWFERPYPHRGPAFGALLTGGAATRAAERHAEVWEQAHDVGPAVWNILSKAERSGDRLRTSTG